jgi:hydroxymethylbilane synthase
MSQDLELRLGTRRSPLAMAQATEARARLCAAHGWDESAIELVGLEATGDKIQDRPLAEVGGKALWTRELEALLEEDYIDAAVHSMKDVETIRPENLVLAAVLPRADVRDVLVGAASIAELPRGARVGTGSPRRAAQLLHLRPDLRIVPFRGNVGTRLAKLEAGEVDATLLAAAGLARLGLVHVGTPLDPGDWLPAASQGAIGIEGHVGAFKTNELLAAIDHAPSRAQVLAERALLEGLGGTCHSPVAAMCTGSDELTLRAALFSPDGKDRVDGETQFAAGDPTPPKALAAELLARAPSSIAEHFNGA